MMPSPRQSLHVHYGRMRAHVGNAYDVQMINADLLRPATWRPLVSALAAGPPTRATSIEFRATIARRYYEGSTFDDGVPRRTRDTVMQAARPLSGLVGDAGVAVRVLVSRTGDAEVDIVESSMVSFGTGSALLDTVLL